MKTKTLMTILAGMLVFSFVSAALAIPANNNAGGPERVRVLIGFRNIPGPSEQALVRAHGGVIKYSYRLVPGIAASVPKTAINGLSRNPNVTMIEEDLTVYAIDAELDNSWGVKHIGAGTVHANNNKGAGVKVAIIDSGIDYNHEDLNANYAGGYDFVNSDAYPMDDHGHGTHVAGTVAAEDDGSGVVGVAPEAQIYGLKVLSARGSGSYSNVIAALEWAILNGIQVTNNSYGSSGYPGLLVELMFDLAEDEGIVNVCAAGNSGNSAGTGENMIYPARFASCIAVAATRSNDDRASFSSTGPDVEISAPGVFIYSTIMGGGHGYASGTSMACPHVAGVVALMINASVADVRDTLATTADDLGDPGWDPQYGYGLVNAVDAVGALTPPLNTPPTVSITSPANGSTFETTEEIEFTGTANDSEDGIITENLAWISSIDGSIGSGGYFSRTLSEGTHTITASVTDSDGASASDSVNITVNSPAVPPLNTPPTVSIASPADGSMFDSGESITFEGTAYDTEDGSLTTDLEWTSSINGLIGSGGSFSTSLSVGTHTITASVTDSGSASASNSISITVNDAADLSVTITKHAVKTRWDKRNNVGKVEAQITFIVNSGSSGQVILEEITDGLGTWNLEKPQVEVKVNGARYKWIPIWLNGVCAIVFEDHDITLGAGDIVQLKIKFLNNMKGFHSLECNIYEGDSLRSGPDVVDWTW